MGSMVQRNWLILFVPLGMLAVTTAAVYYPQHRELTELSERVATQRSGLESDLETVARLPQIIDEVEAMKSRYRNFDRRLPKRQELGEFLREITLNLPREDLVSDRIEPGSPTPEERFHTLPIRMQLRGRFLSLARFLRRVESMERLARVDKLAIESETGSDELNIDMRMNIYFIGD